MHKIAFLLLAPLLCGALSACAAADGGAGARITATPVPIAAPQPAAAQDGDTLTRIRALVGIPSCSADAQCKTLALGAQPCGGPEGYLAFSSTRTPEADLRALADVYRSERHAANSRSGMMSDCRVRPEPGTVCRAGACTLDAAASAPAAR
jgi:hypothetical protein